MIKFLNDLDLWHVIAIFIFCAMIFSFLSDLIENVVNPNLSSMRYCVSESRRFKDKDLEFVTECFNNINNIKK